VSSAGGPAGEVVAPLVVELLTEELPPKALPRLGTAFAGALLAGLQSRGVAAAEAAVIAYATPRRLAAYIDRVRAVAPDTPVVEKLMPRKVAEDAAGRPTLALRKRLSRLGREHLADGYPDARDGADHLYVTSDASGEYALLETMALGQPLVRALEEALHEAIDALPIPKVMSYAAQGSYYNDVHFVRPAHGLLALHGRDVVGVRALALAAGRTTAGHRFLGRPDLEIASADAYAPTLEAQGKVLPAFDARRAGILDALGAAAGDASVLAPEALLDEVTALVEWPVVYEGRFDPAFLAVPQECLILTMQQNQKYFALRDADGRLLPRFLLVANVGPANGRAIVEGNERVLRARLADARFFYEQDQRTPLAARVPRLASVVYHRELGTQAERVERLRTLASRIAPLVGADAAAASRAAMLAKADLVTDMVGEFPELQGTMGRYYAQHDGEPAAVADAVAQHYWPRFAGDALPAQPVAIAVALADKLESLAGLFGVGQLPTGDKDPYGLRRAALGVVRILVERSLDVPLPTLVDLAYDSFGEGRLVAHRGEAVPFTARKNEVLDFIYERLRGYLRDLGYGANEVASVIDRRPESIADLPQRLAAVRAFEAMPEAGALAAANKRIVNILRKAGAEAEAQPFVDGAVITPGAEQGLYQALKALVPVVEHAVERGDYTAALVACASARDAVDRFFDDVMVMAEEPALRHNRLALLRGVRATMNRVADIALLA
jgi:glycyl-tRNA synthetase beta chain